MLYGGGLLALALLALWVYCILDVIATEEAMMRNLSKVLWLIIVILLPTIGSLAWLLLGRPENAGYRPGDTTPRETKPRPSLPRSRPRPLGPEDSPEFIADLDERVSRLRKWEEDLERREEDLRRRETDDPDDPPPDSASA